MPNQNMGFAKSFTIPLWLDLKSFDGSRTDLKLNFLIDRDKTDEADVKLKLSCFHSLQRYFRLYQSQRLAPTFDAWFHFAHSL